ncbi:MAG: Nif3-like dinuclear metal center hexameric protein [Gemmatimonadota bacterium]|nr:Nif3-like dinuclear metal center hexameric protein [Gemmatimonadota bacterium]
MTSLQDVVRHLDALLRTADVPDYDRALNGLQLANGGAASRVAAAVDFSGEAVRRAVHSGADLLLVHHGMFWDGLRPITGGRYQRLALAVQHGLAVYASHLPLDLHDTLGNNAQLAARLGLTPDERFGRFQSTELGLTGGADLATTDLAERVRAFAGPLGTQLVVSGFAPERRTRRWAVVTGAGASSATLDEASARGVDTLIVGEGPHHTAVEAQERGIVVMYAGHYATETLGVQALAMELERQYALPWSFLHIPTGL